VLRSLEAGSFYSYFESKGDLYAETVTHILHEKQLPSGDGVSINPRAVDNAAQFIRDYLSLEQFEDVERTCPLVAFPTEFLRKEERVRQAFETVLKVMIDVFEQALGVMARWLEAEFAPLLRCASAEWC
jgi:AcrR family transcriptional regulator